MCGYVAYRPCNHTLYNIPPIRFVFQVTQKDLRNSLMMADYCRNMYEPVHRVNEWYNQCILLVISTTSNMHGTNIKLVLRVPSLLTPFASNVLPKIHCTSPHTSYLSRPYNHIPYRLFTYERTHHVNTFRD
jgi:hypothetical protein